MSKRTEHKTGQAKDREKKDTHGKVVRRRLPQVPPPESELWPECCRGKRWKSVFAILFGGKCQLCAYSFEPPRSQQLRNKWLGQTPTLLCTNHPGSPGALQEVLPTGTCRNFRAKHWKPTASEQTGKGQAEATEDATFDESVRRISLSQGLFATVDAGDYEALSKYKWLASRRGRKVYAVCRVEGRYVYMHRMIMQAPKGLVVDHIDGNGSNNRRTNLRICTPQQNMANRGPRGGTSKYVGVYLQGTKWCVRIGYHGQNLYLGLFDDEIEAARARDRKAYELHGPHVYLNLPEDYDR